MAAAVAFYTLEPQWQERWYVHGHAGVGVHMMVIPGHTDQMAEILPAIGRLAREVLPAF